MRIKLCLSVVLPLLWKTNVVMTAIAVSTYVQAITNSQSRREIRIAFCSERLPNNSMCVDAATSANKQNTPVGLCPGFCTQIAFATRTQTAASSVEWPLNFTPADVVVYLCS